MIVKKTDQKEVNLLKQNYNHYIEKRSEMIKNTQFRVEDVFGDVISKDSISTELITKLKNFLAEVI